MAKRKSKKPPRLPKHLFDKNAVAETFSKGKAQEIWNWSWINAEEGAWHPHTHRRDIEDGLSREFFFSGDMNTPAGRAAVRIAEAAVLTQHRGAVVAQPNQRAGFTYGYQWADVQPDSYLKFPIEGKSQDGRKIRVYPVNPAEVIDTNPIELLIEQPDERGPNRWHRFFLGGGQRILPDEDTDSRLRIALDWHEENGYSVQPFVQAPWMPPWLQVDLDGLIPRDPTVWMDKAVVEWVHRWRDVGELYWLDTKIESEEQWTFDILPTLGGRTNKYVVYNLDVWGNARDGYEVNNQSRAGEIEVPEGGDVIQALVDGDFLRAEAANDVEIEDQFDHIEVNGPEIPVDDAPERTEPEGDLPEAFADEVWQYGWEQGLDPDFRSESGDSDELQHIDVNNHWPVTVWRELLTRIGDDPNGDFDHLTSDAYDIARVAFDAAVEATRNDSRIPLFRLDLVTE